MVHSTTCGVGVGNDALLLCLNFVLCHPTLLLRQVYSLF